MAGKEREYSGEDIVHTSCMHGTIERLLLHSCKVLLA